MKHIAPISALLVLLLAIVYFELYPLWSAGDADVQATLLTQFSSRLEESSALAVHADSLWTLNDSGSGPEIHRLSMSGEYQQTITIPGVSSVDWESLASDDDYLYVADTGNNANDRAVLSIYRIAWQGLLADAARAETIELRYADHEAGVGFSHNFDAEGLAVRGQELWLFSKNRGDRQTKLYRFPKTPSSYQPSPSQTLPVDALITAADIHPDTDELVLIGRHSSGLDRVWIASVDDDGVDWDSAQSASFGPTDQWEAVAWDREAQRLLLTHEDSARGFAGLAELALPLASSLPADVPR